MKSNKLQEEEDDLDQSDDSEDDEDDEGCCMCFSIGFYKPYFKVTEHEVFNRIKTTFLPFRSDFSQSISDNPDLWGPIWISATLVLLIAVVSNFKTLITNGSDYNVSYVPQAAALLYCISFGTPILLTLIMKLLGSEISLFETICLYGYSMSTLLPITVLCVIQSQILHWVLVTYGILNSCIFLANNLQQYYCKLDIQKKYIITGVLFAMQVSLYVLFKIIFFKVIHENKAPV